MAASTACAISGAIPLSPVRTESADLGESYPAELVFEGKGAPPAMARHAFNGVGRVLDSLDFQSARSEIRAEDRKPQDSRVDSKLLQSLLRNRDWKSRPNVIVLNPRLKEQGIVPTGFVFDYDDDDVVVV